MIMRGPVVGGSCHRASVNPGLINNVGMNPPSKLPLRRPLQQGLVSTEETTWLGDNRLKILRHAKTRFSGLQRH
eukprot:5793461-Pyramimonas_sp.AAC.1